jgi:hypothetical protein
MAASLLALICTTLVIAGARKWKPEGWAQAWVYLIGVSAGFRILLWLLPNESPLLSRGVIFLGLALALARAKWKAHLRYYRISLPNLAFVLLAALVMARSIFPNYDVDSLSYHLSAIRWLYHKSSLPDLQAHAQGVYLAYRVIGFEEFLGIPALDADLGLWSGLIGGWLKVLTLFSVLSLVLSLPVVPSLVSSNSPGFAVTV